MAEAVHKGEVKCLPFRTTGLADRSVSVPRNLVRELEEDLARRAGVTPTDDVIYKFVDELDEIKYVLFSNTTATFGKSIYGRGW